MKFSSQSITEKDLSIVRLTDHSTQTMIDILPDYGAILHGFTIQAANGSFNIIDNYPDKKAVEGLLSTSFKSAKLSPFVCRIPEGTYQWEDKRYELSNKFKDGSAIHGILYNKSFNVVDQYSNEEQAAVRLKYQYKKEDEGYPFNYSCEIVYILHPGNRLQIETTVRNLDVISIPLADGWHPYFTLGGKINDYQLQFASDTLLEFDDKLVPTGKFLYDPSFIEPTRIGDRFLDNCFQLQWKEGVPVCKMYNPASQLTLFLYTNANYPYLQLFTPDHRNSIAIENLSGAPNCFNNGMGLITLLPRHTQTFNVWYQLLLG